MTARFSRFAGSSVLVAVLLLAGLLIVPQHAKGQLWLQTSRIITPAGDGPMRVLVDSLVAVMERKNVQVKRSPDAEQTFTIRELENTLIEEAGIGLSSGINQAFIDYRFTIENEGGFQQNVASIHFVFRLGPAQSDVPILHLNARQPWVKNFLRSKGTSLSTNEAALILFRHHLGFVHLGRLESTQIVEIGGETIRDGFIERKQALIRKVEHLTYEDV